MCIDVRVYGTRISNSTDLTAYEDEKEARKRFAFRVQKRVTIRLRSQLYAGCIKEVHSSERSYSVVSCTLRNVY